MFSLWVGCLLKSLWLEAISIHLDIYFRLFMSKNVSRMSGGYQKAAMFKLILMITGVLLHAFPYSIDVWIHCLIIRYSSIKSTLRVIIANFWYVANIFSHNQFLWWHFFHKQWLRLNSRHSNTDYLCVFIRNFPFFRMIYCCSLTRRGKSFCFNIYTCDRSISHLFILHRKPMGFNCVIWQPPYFKRNKTK